MVLNDDAPSFARSQGRANLVDGRSDKIRAVDSCIGAYAAGHGVEPKKPSELKREDGLRLVKKFGIAVCTRRSMVRRQSGHTTPRSSDEICGYLIVVRNGEKLPRCNGCGHRIWVRSEEVIFQHDNLKIVKMVVSSVKGWQGRGGEIYRLSMSKLNNWAGRSEKRIEGRAEVKHFFDHMPWNLANFSGKNNLRG